MGGTGCGAAGKPGPGAKERALGRREAEPAGHHHWPRSVNTALGHYPGPHWVWVWKTGLEGRPGPCLLKGGELGEWHWALLPYFGAEVKFIWVGGWGARASFPREMGGSLLQTTEEQKAGGLLVGQGAGHLGATALLVQKGSS